MPARPRPSPLARFGARAVLAGAGLLVATVAFALLLFGVQGSWPPLERVDGAARDDLYALAVRHDGFVGAMRVLSALGSAAFYLPLFAVLATWLVRHNRARLALFCVVTPSGSQLLNLIAKAAVDRARPVLADPLAHASGLSFPSGHAQAAIVGYGVLLLVVAPRLRRRRRAAACSAAAAMVVAIGFSRVALGVHYVSDVLAGYALGTAWLAAMAAAFRAWRRDDAAERVNAGS